MAGGAPALGAVTPPGLLDGFRNPDPEYPAASQRRGEEGRVRLLIQVSEAGTAVDAEVVGGSGYPTLDEAARRGVLRWRFKPATRDGQPVAGRIIASIQFRIPR